MSSPSPSLSQPRLRASPSQEVPRRVKPTLTPSPSPTCLTTTTRSGETRRAGEVFISQSGSTDTSHEARSFPAEQLGPRLKQAQSIFKSIPMRPLERKNLVEQEPHLEQARTTFKSTPMRRLELKHRLEQERRSEEERRLKHLEEQERRHEDERRTELHEHERRNELGLRIEQLERENASLISERDESRLHEGKSRQNLLTPIAGNLQDKNEVDPSQEAVSELQSAIESAELRYLDLEGKYYKLERENVELQRRNVTVGEENACLRKKIEKTLEAFIPKARHMIRQTSVNKKTQDVLNSLMKIVREGLEDI